MMARTLLSYEICGLQIASTGAAQFIMNLIFVYFFNKWV